MQKNEGESMQERALLIGLSAGSFAPDENSDEKSMDELESLLETAGGLCVGRVIQNKDAPDPRTLIGEGKAEEARVLGQSEQATLAVFDNELSPMQVGHLEKALGLRVVDRSSLILDIFASRAITKEGRLQVELAQLQYTLPRLTGRGLELSRLGGGIGTRGPGESQLETDRRHIRRKISLLRAELGEVRRVRGVQRERRIKNEIPVAALIGYTNAGKSTLLNTLTGAGIPANDRLFDTLDPTTRSLRLSDTMEILLTDTVGFIRKLPHHLVEAFKATLEELQYASVLLHVIDLSNPDWEMQAQVVDDMIAQIGVTGTPVIRVYNKADLCDYDIMPGGSDAVAISAKTGAGIDKLLGMVEKQLDTGRKKVNLRLPYEQASLLDSLYREAKVLRTDYRDDAIDIDVIVDQKTLGRVRAYIAVPEGSRDG